MPKALFFNIPAHGHINPSLPLVAELTQRGHEIRYYATEQFRQRITHAGAEFFPYPTVKDDYFEAKGLNGTIPQQAAQAMLTTTKAILPELIEITHEAQPDYIIYDCMCPWGYFLAKAMKLPAVSSFSLLPLSPRVMLNWKIFRLFLPALVKGLSSGIAASRLSDELGKQYDVEPLNQMNVLNAPGDLSISYSSSAFVPFANSLGEHFRLVGWTMQENTSDKPFIHDSERPLIYISLGTLSNENFSFFQMCIEALADTPYDVLITTGGRFDRAQFGNLPDNITIESWVPQSQVIQQAALFITHGGLNSLHDGLYCGLPLLIVPQQTEQTINGLRVVELEAGLMLKPDKVSSTTIINSVMTLLNDSRYTENARQLGETFRTAGGVVRAVNEIEKLLSYNRSNK